MIVQGLNNLVLNYKKILQVCLRVGELAFSVSFYGKLKLATDPISKNHGPVLRYALIAINNRLYNYDFGRDTNVIKYVYSFVFFPSLMTHLLNLQSLYSAVQVCSIVFEALCMTDLLNTTQSYFIYNILLIIKIVRMFDNMKQLCLAFNLPWIRDVKKRITKLDKIPQKDSKTLIPSIKIAEVEIECATKSDLVQDLSKLNDQHLFHRSANKNQVSTDDSVGSSLPLAEKHVDLIEKIIAPQKKPHVKIIQQSINLPLIKMKITTAQGQYFIDLKDPYEFDAEFSQLQGMSELQLLHSKLYYCTQVYRIIKNNAKRELKLHALYIRLMTYYTSAIMLVDA